MEWDRHCSAGLAASLASGVDGHVLSTPVTNTVTTASGQKAVVVKNDDSAGQKCWTVLVRIVEQCWSEVLDSAGQKC